MCVGSERLNINTDRTATSADPLEVLVHYPAGRRQSEHSRDSGAFVNPGDANCRSFYLLEVWAPCVVLFEAFSTFRYFWKATRRLSGISWGPPRLTYHHSKAAASLTLSLSLPPWLPLGFHSPKSRFCLVQLIIHPFHRSGLGRESWIYSSSSWRKYKYTGSTSMSRCSFVYSKK